MSLGSRIAIGIVSLISAFGLWLTVADASELTSIDIVTYGMAFLCVVIAVACFFPNSHPFSLRIIGTAIFVGYAAYVIDSFHNGGLGQALLGFFIWGLPSGYLVIFGTYPRWGKGSTAFGTNPRKR